VLRFGSPQVLYAGLALALLPLLLHLIVRRPANRKALPTARFLSPDPRTRPRLQRRPTDVPLLLVRTLFVLLVAAAFGRPEWSAARSGTVELLLLDAGSGMAPVWEEALQAARDRLPAAAGLLVFDTTARSATGASAVALLDSLMAAGPAAAEARYHAGLRGVQALVAALPAPDSARLTLITLPRWDAWGAGLAAVRAAAWPGGIELLAPGRAAGAAPGPGNGAAIPTRRAVVLAGPPRASASGVYAAAALGATGWDVSRNMLSDATIRDSVAAAGTTAGEASGAQPAGLIRPGPMAAGLTAADLYLVLGALPETTARELLERVRGGVTVMVSGQLPAGPLGSELPWVEAGGGGVAGAGTDPPAAGGLPAGGVAAGDRPAGDRPAGDVAAGALLVGGDLRAGGTRLRGAGSRYAGGPAEGARVLAVWDDGVAAAAARRVGGGCMVYIATDVEAGRLPFDPGFPTALERLIDGCTNDEARNAAALAGWRVATGPLDGGARMLLEGAGAPEAVALSALPGAAGGTRLFRWFVLAALLVALLETMMAYGRTART
jgi:hypothetical protein